MSEEKAAAAVAGEIADSGIQGILDALEVPEEQREPIIGVLASLPKRIGVFPRSFCNVLSLEIADTGEEIAVLRQVLGEASEKVASLSNYREGFGYLSLAMVALAAMREYAIRAQQ